MPELKDWVTLVALLLGPALGVVLAQRLQDRKVKIDQKKFVFFALVGNRQDVVAADRIRALNMIDVAFHDEDTVTAAWHAHFNVLNVSPLNADESKRTFVELLSAMAKVLHYESVTQMSFDRHYLPIGIVNANAQSAALQAAMSEFLNRLIAILPTPVAPTVPPTSAKKTE